MRHEPSYVILQAAAARARCGGALAPLGAALQPRPNLASRMERASELLLEQDFKGQKLADTTYQYVIVFFSVRAARARRTRRPSRWATSASPKLSAARRQLPR